MQQRNLEQRVTMLEAQMQALKEVPGRLSAVESQILHLRVEMQDGLSAIRADLQTEIRAGDEATRTYMRTLFEDLVARIALTREGGSQ